MCASFSITVSYESSEIAGVNISSYTNRKGVDSKLILNGAGIRYKFFFKIYVAVLYLSVQEKNDFRVLQSFPSKRMMVYIAYSEVLYEKLVTGWGMGLKTIQQKIFFLYWNRV